MQNLKCLACLAEGKLAVRAANGNGSTTEPVANDAITLAPSWQQMQVGPQQLWGVVALPTCGDHLQVKRQSALDLGQGVVLQGKPVR